MASNEELDRSDSQPEKQRSRPTPERTPPLLPDVTSDEMGAQTAFDDDWYLEQRPPHHGG